MGRLAVRRRLIALVALAGVVMVSTHFYLVGQRRAGDAYVAARTLEALGFAQRLHELRGEVMPTHEAVLSIVLFLNSDSAARTSVTPRVRKAYLALRVCDQLILMRRSGDTSPSVDSVPGGIEALEEFPAIRSFVRVNQGRRRFMNGDDRLWKTLDREGARETAAAAADLANEYPAFEGIADERNPRFGKAGL